jgi:hypothetical protein
MSGEPRVIHAQEEAYACGDSRGCGRWTCERCRGQSCSRTMRHSQPMRQERPAPAVSELPSLRQLEYFLVLVDTGHFRRAAERCGIAQPSLSVQLANLEKTLGLILVERARSGVVITPAGREVAARARRMVRQMAALAKLPGSPPHQRSPAFRPSRHAKPRRSECPRSALRDRTRHRHARPVMVIRPTLRCGAAASRKRSFIRSPLTGASRGSVIRTVPRPTLEPAVPAGRGPAQMRHAPPRATDGPWKRCGHCCHRTGPERRQE